MELDLLQNLQVEAGAYDDNFIEPEYFVKMRFRVANPDRPVMASSRFVDRQAYRLRDMRKHTLDKVRRQNEIILERSSGGIVIARGD